MYAKLVFRNAKRSVKDYLIYIVTMTICVTLFYSFLSISSRYYQPDIGSEYNFTILSDGMKAAICVITLFLLFLIRFVNHYMLRRKQKEFAVQQTFRSTSPMSRRSATGMAATSSLMARTPLRHGKRATVGVTSRFAARSSTAFLKSMKLCCLLCRQAFPAN